MGPIDIRYHAISLAAMFLALGVGIIVGSSTNFLGITSILERQDKVINRLESNYKEIRKEIHNTREELNSSKEYTATLESALIPKLLNNKLDGFRFGIVTVGDLPEQNITEENFASPFKSAGAVTAFVLRVKPEKLSELAGADTGSFVVQFGKELLRGSSFGSTFTGKFAGDSSLISGNFDQPVDGIVFLIGDNADIKVVQSIVIPLERLVAENQGLTAAAEFGDKDTYVQTFKNADFLFYKNADTLSGQIEIISRFEDAFRQKQEQEKVGSKSR